MTLKTNSLLIITSVLGCVMVLWLHLGNADSIIYEETIDAIVHYHAHESAFARRPLTTFLVQNCAQLLSLSIGKSFVVVNFSLLFLSAFTLARLTYSLTKSVRFAHISQLSFFLTFSILFAFYQPIYSYDEPLQYLFIFLALLAFLNQHTGLFIIFFFLACITRETSLVLLPGLMVFSGFKSRRHWGMYSLPPLLFGLYLFVYFTVNETGLNEFTYRMQVTSTFIENVINQPRTAISWSIVTLVPLLLLFKIQSLRSEKYQQWKKAFFLTLLLNSILVFATANANETRLFALPLIFFWPIAGQLIIHWYRYFHCPLPTILISIVVSALAAPFIFMYYNPSIGTGGNGLFQLYLVLYALVVLFIAFSKRQSE